MTDTITYSVPGMSSGHCRAAITAEVSAVPGVQQVDVDLDAKLVTIGGNDLDDGALVAAIDEAGYEAVRARAGSAACGDTSSTARLSNIRVSSPNPRCAEMEQP